MDDSIGARPSETGSHPSGQAPSGLGASRFDPARMAWEFIKAGLSLAWTAFVLWLFGLMEFTDRTISAFGG